MIFSNNHRIPRSDHSCGCGIYLSAHDRIHFHGVCACVHDGLRNCHILLNFLIGGSNLGFGVARDLGGN